MAGAADRQRLFAAGVGKAKAGLHAEALRLFERVRRLGLDAALLNAIAITRKNLGDLDGARQAYGQAMRLEPGNPDLLFNLAKLEMDCGRPAAAVPLLERSLSLRPGPSAWKNLGVCRLDLEDSREAVTAFTRAAELAPGDPVPWSYVGAAWQQAGDLTQAEQAHAQALALQPDNPEILNNLGSTRLLQRRLNEADAAFRRAIAIWPDYAEAHYGLAWVLLYQQRFTEGWREWEWRLKRRRFAEPPATAPLWDGQPFAGTLVVHSEIGFGDSINFARFLPAARARCDRVLFACQRPLVPLLAAAFPDIDIVADDARRPPGDRFCYVMSLPTYFVTSTADIDGRAYLTAERSFDLGPADGRKRVGVCWSSTRKGIDPHRFLAAGTFADAILADCGQARFYSLQKGLKPAEKAAVTALAEDLEPRLNDFADTAAAIAGLDLVVTVDTAVAHLAGALGVPSLVMLHHGADWRWFDAPTCPWYHKARLFRQPAPGAWKPVLSEMRGALDRFLS
jgi:Flp pilus assembly protein TadD